MRVYYCQCVYVYQTVLIRGSTLRQTHWKMTDVPVATMVHGNDIMIIQKK